MSLEKQIRPNDWSEDEVESPDSPSPPSAKPEAPKKFRMQCKNFFLTFPQCQTTKEDAVSRLKERFPSGKLLVCHEKHMSGDDHLHALVQLDHSLNVKDARYFDFVGGTHGKYEPARNIRRSVEYITKKGDYIADGIDVEAILKKERLSPERSRS